MPTHIRLVHIESAPAKDIVRCNLREIDLESEPKYTALSYRWEKEKSSTRRFVGGIQWQRLFEEPSDTLQNDEKHAAKRAHGRLFSQSKPSHEDGRYLIFCNGRRAYVQANLYDALIQLRKEEPAAYWIDALCINQNDDNEKSAQIQMMGRIYESAEKVAVWLGRLPTLLQPVMESLIKSDQNETSKIFTHIMSNKIDPMFVAKRLAVFAWLLTRDWFRRAWVIQEYCFARNPVFLLAGFKVSEDVMKNHLSSCVIAFEEDEDKDDLSAEVKEEIFKSKLELVQLLDAISTATIPVNTLVQGIMKMMQSRGVFADGKRWALHQWLEVMKGRGAKDVRDFIFAGISLIDPKSLMIDQKIQLDEFSQAADLSENKVVGVNGSDTKLWSAIIADYTAEPRVVLLNLSACILTGYGWERLFYHTLRFRHPPNDFLEPEMPLSENPSWVLDPSISTSRVLEPAYMFHEYFSPTGSTSSINAKPKISPDGSTLFLTASKLDEITQCVSTRNLDQLLGDRVRDITPAYDALLSLIDFAASKVPSTYPHLESPGLQILLIVLVSYVYFLPRSVGPMNRSALRYYLSIMIERAVRKVVDAIDESPGTKDSQTKKERLLLALDRVKERHPEEAWGSDSEADAGSDADDMSSLDTDDMDSLDTDDMDSFDTDDMDSLDTDDMDSLDTDDMDNLDTDDMDSLDTDDMGSLDTDEMGSLNADDVNSLDADDANSPEAELPESDSEPETTSQISQDSEHKPVPKMLDVYLQLTSAISLKYFTTAKGCLGMGPAWLQEGDSIFLIPGGSTPMIFAHMDDVLRRKIVHLRGRVGRKGLDGKVPKRKEMEEQVSALEARIGRRDAYQLVGEAYIEGIMQGEVAESLEREVQRVEIV